jgi:hypothetical protein
MARVKEQVEWLNLVDISGPFLVATVLGEVFPQGLDEVETSRRQHLRAAYEEWQEELEVRDESFTAIHDEWLRLVLQDALEFEDSVLMPREKLDSGIAYESPEHGVEVTPDFGVQSGDGKPHLLINIYPPDVDLTKAVSRDRWAASPAERMTLLCRANEVRVGLITNGEQWMAVNAPVGNTSGTATWHARLWWQEPVTLKAFVSLLGVRRWFGQADRTLDQMLERSTEFQEEVTDTLGEQVRRAVEVLIQALGRADQDRNGELLVDIPSTELYEAGLTVMMRLVFILCAEERGLLLLGEPIYDQHYAISTLRAKLHEDADQYGVEVLERRQDAWSRMLTVFRAVYGGIEHESLRLPALGGSLFDPDRFPFLEGRPKGTTWRDTPANPLPIDNRTALLLLDALQVLEQTGGAMLLSYKALDVEQIGHVYEGLLEYTAARVPEVTLGLIGTKKCPNPSATLADLEQKLEEGVEPFAKWLKELTGRSLPALRRAAQDGPDEAILPSLVQACGGDEELARQIMPFGSLIRADSWGNLLVYKAGSYSIAHGSGRRETGTHYTPRSLTETIVEHTLEPIVYSGPAEGQTRDEWKLKSPAELLDLKVCDPAMGSGAFLVQVCRYLSQRLVEAWEQAEASGSSVNIDGVVVDATNGDELLPAERDDRLLTARRLIAERCLYGVDLNPLAVELAKLSIWLTTLAKGRPFGFLDHNLRRGDSLLGITGLYQLTQLDMKPRAKAEQRLFGRKIEEAAKAAVKLRGTLRNTRILDIRDVQRMRDIDDESRRLLGGVTATADAFIGTVLAKGTQRGGSSAIGDLAGNADQAAEGDGTAISALQDLAQSMLGADLPESGLSRRPFHWPLEFPEVLAQEGFSAIVGNPPFIGGKKISRAMGGCYRRYLMRHLAGNRPGSADLCAYFYLRCFSLLSPTGQMGLLATNTIAQGDTREVGLDTICRFHGTIRRAVPSSQWPGSASLEIAQVHICKGAWDGERVLSGHPVEEITPYLTSSAEVSGTPTRLAANADSSYQGSIILGQGFLLTPDEAQAIIAEDTRNADVLFPYLNGQDLNSSPDQSPSRWAINFFDWPLRRDNLSPKWAEAGATRRKAYLSSGVVPEDYSGPVAADYPHCLCIVEERVKPERDAKKRKAYRERWWLYAERQKSLYEMIEAMDSFCVTAQTSKYTAITLMQTSTIVFSNAVIVLGKEGFDSFALLSSSLHAAWVRKYSSSLETRLRYVPTDCYETFPFPESMNELRDIGAEYHRHRSRLMLERDAGLTSIYNDFHSPERDDADTQAFRNLHMHIDDATLLAYGWSDIPLDHGFRDTAEGKRFAICEEARCEILQRLLALNHGRYAEEATQDAHSRKGE